MSSFQITSLHKLKKPELIELAKSINISHNGRRDELEIRITAEINNNANAYTNNSVYNRFFSNPNRLVAPFQTQNQPQLQQRSLSAKLSPPKLSPAKIAPAIAPASP